MSQDTARAAPVRVIIAEDEAIVRLDIKEILLSAGYEVVGETGRGDEAVSLAAETTPDLAILDVKMPGMSGIQAAREMTRDAKVAVMVLTAFSQRELIEEARDGRSGRSTPRWRASGPASPPPRTRSPPGGSSKRRRAR